MMTKRAIIVGLLFAVFAYYLVVVYVLHFSLDAFVLPHARENINVLPPPYLMVSSNGNELLIRRYGNAINRCVIFFPGQHGGIVRYQHDLFPSLVRDGITVFSVSYPGQDGAGGHARLAALPRLIETGLTKLNDVCKIKDAVFIGRSLGSMMAVYQAAHWHPKGLVLDGIAPSLSDAIYTYMGNHWYLRPARVLPIKHILRRDYVLGTVLDQLASTKVIVFQGSLDKRTPLPLAKQAVAGRANVKFIEVPGASHSNVYLKAFAQYIDSIVTLLNAKSNYPIKQLLTSRHLVPVTHG
jgi:hypothetical protein